MTFFLLFFPSFSIPSLFFLPAPVLFLLPSYQLSVAVDHEEATIDLTSSEGQTTQFKYDKVYGPESTQEALYTEAVAPIVEEVCNGVSCAIFAYGTCGVAQCR